MKCFLDHSCNQSITIHPGYIFLLSEIDEEFQFDHHDLSSLLTFGANITI